jgi:hypothetical protein
MNEDTPDLSFHSLDLVDEAFVRDMCDALESALDKVNASPFKVGAKEFIPLSVAPSVDVASLSTKIAALSPSLSVLFQGVGKDYKYQKDLTDETNFKFLDLSTEGGTFVASFRVQDYKRTGNESYTAVDVVVYLDKQGRLQAVPVVKKAIIAGGAMVPGALPETTQNRVNKLKNLESLGVPIIHLHGVDAKTAILYESLYPAGTDELLDKMKVDATVAEHYLPQLWDIASCLDTAGYASQDFLSDIVFDGERFRYLDAGADVGYENSIRKDDTPSQDLLLRTFPDYEHPMLQNNVAGLQQETAEATKRMIIDAA